MNNALEAMPGGGTLSVSLRDEGVSALVQVDDDGPGIPAQIRVKLFQPFESQGKKNGLGLGLALSRQTAMDHGGDMWVAEKDMPGARFFVRLPKGQA